MIREFTGEPVTPPDHDEFLENKREANRLWRMNNADYIKETKRRDYELNGEKIRRRSREYHHRQNTQRDIERITAWKHANPNRVARSRLLKNAKVRATALGLAFDLTLEDITLPEVCPVLGIEIVFGRGQVQPGSPTVDRVVPEKGYVRGNVCVISHRANQIKSNGTIAEHEAVLRYMRERA
nr:MAG TPA: restriction endonuclease [Caudoviricetes sp.]